MAQIIKELAKGYTFLFEDIANPHIRDWFLMSSPWPGLAIIALYLWFIKDFGPKMMMYREPFKIDRIIQIYNIAQIFISGFTFYKMMKHGWGGRYSWRCAPSSFELDDPDEYMMAVMSHVYFITKVIDLLDTVFFVLRKKFNQISFLHIYHHAGMVALSWGGLTWFSTGHCTMLMCINSLVHTVMYGYYYLTSVSPEYKKSVWWKKYITRLQLAQFMFLGVFFGQVVFYNPCNFAAFALLILIPQNIFMFILFSDFYYKTYVKKKPNKAS